LPSVPQVPEDTKVRSVVAERHAAAGGTLHTTPPQTSPVHRPSAQPIAQVKSTEVSTQSPVAASQALVNCRAVELSEQVGALGVHTTPAHFEASLWQAPATQR
jgi:hypothetical protein